MPVQPKSWTVEISKPERSRFNKRGVHSSSGARTAAKRLIPTGTVLNVHSISRFAAPPVRVLAIVWCPSNSQLLPRDRFIHTAEPPMDQLSSRDVPEGNKREVQRR